ncbi:aldose epimerase family protein [Nonomuraea sp. B5E05]|uniref:aldose epimerase family protein n=1 Tax=Nonomuraea sp. B5E05 TaxID=3153569 RepID=UPI0032604AFE
MDIRHEIAGWTTGGGAAPSEPVDSYTISTDGSIAVTVWSYGATLVEVLVEDNMGHPANVVKRLPDLAAYENRALNAYVGCTMGRFCRCVAEGRFVLDGVEYTLDRNEGLHHVHGGPDGFDRRVWRSRVEETQDEISVVFLLISPDGDQGYPGEVAVEAAYRLHESGRLTFEYTATTTAPTIVGLTNHAFWNLAGEGTIDDHVLAVNAARVLRFDDELIPMGGELSPVAGGPLDFRVPRRLGSTRVDNYLVLDGDRSWTAELRDPRSGRRMRVTTDQPGFGVYSGDWLAEPRTGLCLAASAWPDAPNLPRAPSVRLDPGTTYAHRTLHEFPPAVGTA